MQTRRDQLHAYRFQNRRALAALVTGEPNVLEPPMRRLTVVTISGIMIAILLACGFALVGIIKPAGGDAWREPGAIIVERQTGARYVLLDHVLHPVLNYSSAVLAVASAQRPHVVLVDRGDLAGTQRGPAIGIDQLPDSLPAAGDLIRSPWTVCSRQQAGTGDEVDARVSVSVGADAGAQVLSRSSGVLVHAPGADERWLLFGGHRLSIASGAVAASLRLASTTALEVGTAFLDGIPAGPALKAPDIPGTGSPSVVSVGGETQPVGRLLRATDNDEYFLVLADGVAALDEVQTQLLLTVPGPGGSPLEPVETTQSAVFALPQSSAGWDAVAAQLKGLPERVPDIAATPARAGGVCAIYRADSTEPVFAVPASRLPQISTGPVEESDRSRSGQADAVVLRPGSAALVRAAHGSPTLFVVAEPGRKFAVAAPGVLQGFGYDAQTPARVPVEVLPLIPTGPALDPAAARRPVTG